MKVIVGTTSLDEFPVFVSTTLINAIRPSSAPLGKVSVQVTFNGTNCNLAPVTIAANAPGIYTATGAGTRPGILQNFSPQGVPANSPRLAATPGQTAVLWLTGLGPITAADNQASLSELLSASRNSTRASQKMRRRWQRAD